MKIVALSPRNLSPDKYEALLDDLQMDHQVHRINQIDKLKNLLTFEKMDIICIFLGQVDARTIKYLESIRRTFNLEVLVLTDEASKYEIEFIKVQPHYYLLEMPYDKSEFLGIAKKMIYTKNVSQRIHRRFQTKQSVDFNQVSSGYNYTGDLTDLSKTGARIQLKNTKDPGLKSGDLLRLDIPLQDISKSHTVHAKVIWSQTESEGVQAGLEFIPASEVYNHLMGQV